MYSDIWLPDFRLSGLHPCAVFFLQMIPIFFLLPFLYLTVSLETYLGDSSEGVLLLPTPAILAFLKIAAVIWLAGFIAIGLYFAFRIAAFIRMNRDQVEGDRALNAIFQECKKKVGVRENVRIRLSYGTSSPVVFGVFRPVAIEYSCDYDSCEILKNTKRYFEVIVKMGSRASGIQIWVTMPLIEDEHQILRRVKKINHYKTMKRRHTGLAVLLAAGMLTASTVTVLAAGDVLVEGYNQIYNATTVEIEEKVGALPTYVEYTENSTDPDVRIEVDETAGLSRGKTTHIDWAGSPYLITGTSKKINIYILMNDAV